MPSAFGCFARFSFLSVVGATGLLCLPACSSSDKAAIDGGADSDPDTQADPFAEMEDTGEGLTNVSADLNALLEGGTLPNACADYQTDPSNRRKKLLCGKYMFFYEGFSQPGVPKAILTITSSKFPDEIGLGYSKLGMIPDPYSEDDLPLGFGEGATIGNNVPTMALTCASCHFGRLPDGRYAVGAPNHNYEYGKAMLTAMLLPQTVNPLFDEGEHHTDALAAIAPARTKLDGDTALRIEMGTAILPLVSEGNAAVMSVSDEGHYAAWEPGTMDFLIAPLPDDGAHVVTKVLDLWDLPQKEERERFGMPNAHLGYTGWTTSLEGFLQGFVSYGGGEVGEWDEEALSPLVEYIYSLRSPENPDPPAEDEVLRGAQAYELAGCADCHQGPRGSGLELYSFEELGSDNALAKWSDPNGAEACCNLGDYGPPTKKVKSPRLTGSWAKGRFLHNGSVDSLEALLCLEERTHLSRPTPFSAGGHDYGCDLPDNDREAILAFLLSL